MANLLAHSARNGCKEQTYHDHIANVHKLATTFAREAEVYAAHSGSHLENCTHNAALLHDLGKLNKANQQTLRSEHRQQHLPVNHVDAGTVRLLEQHGDFLAAAVVYAHHRGLPDLPVEELRSAACFRDKDKETRETTDRELPELAALHGSVIPTPLLPPCVYPGEPSVFLRLALSCLADADHSDTASAYGQKTPHDEMPMLKAAERLVALDRYVYALGDGSERSLLRREMYESCKNAPSFTDFTACDSPVGSGKTTAVMAHLLAQAAKRGARRIFVVLPYTNIITQAVEVYRNALTLQGENPEAVVAELHSRADFDSQNVRHLTALWRSPIIVTTAVAFFETLASNKPSALRKLHELPGSVLFIDEAHAALPIHLLPLAWQWMDTLAREWGCYWVLASGSLVRYWRIAELIPSVPDVPNLVSAGLRSKLLRYEGRRIAFRWEPQPLSRERLLEKVTSSPGPRLLILNTVQNAAVLADDLRNLYGRERVEHLSTALTPKDRADVIARVKARLMDSGNTDWTLVATSCVEAGVDFSFKTGFREAASLVSLLQAAGRVNRHGREVVAEMWSFVLEDSSMLSKNEQLQTSIDVLKEFLTAETEITPELCTAAIKAELERCDHRIAGIDKLMQAEAAGCFPEICNNFRVIDEQTVTAVADRGLAEQIRQTGGSWQQLQQHAVSVRNGNIQKWHLSELAEGLYEWTLPYDSFLGYMAGVLTLGS